MHSPDYPPSAPLADAVEPHHDVDAVFAPSVASPNHPWQESHNLFGSASAFDQQASSDGSLASHGRVYYPLVDTLRLYAGWLLAWYGAVFALGGYQWTRTLPFKSDIVNDMLSSPFIVVASFATFLFLLLSG
ncbi:hypothetical protein HY213_05020, partial [Candidatus Peregrinibacteria bacterium]|nr:hypothetical protein [Candidatus Peregrinibacteria bacterium]